MAGIASYDLGQLALSMRQESSSAALATTIQLDTSPVLLVGKQIIVDATGTYPETRVVAAVTGRTVRLTSGLTYAHAAGTFVMRILPSTGLINPIKELFIPITGANNATDGTQIVQDSSLGFFAFPDNKLCKCWGETIFPSNMNTSVTISAMVLNDNVAADDKNIFSRLMVYWAGVNESPDTHFSLVAAAAQNVKFDKYASVNSVTISANIASGDIFELEFYRDGTDLLDTLGGTLRVIGFSFVYIDPT